jgi:tetratricopeptide (TPR) repeat protein
MEYQCSNSACKDRELQLPESYAEKLGGKCLTCGANLVVVQSLDELEKDVLANYPHLIAFPFKELIKRKEIASKNDAFKDVLTNILKYFALIAVTEYFRSNCGEEAINEIIERKLRRPLVSAWNDFLKAAVPALDLIEHKWFVPELCETFRKLEEFDGNKLKKANKVRAPGKGFYDENKKFVSTTQPMSRMATLIHFRNKCAHGIRPPSKQATDEFNFHYGLLKDLLEDIKWCRDYPIYKRESNQAYLLMGAEISSSTLALNEALFETNFIIRKADTSSSLSLVPLFIVPSEFLDEVDKDENLLVYDQNTGKRIVYVSPAGHHRELKVPFDQWNQLIESKSKLPLLEKKDLNFKVIRSRCQKITSETQNALRSSGKVIDGLYFHREEIESELVTWQRTSFPISIVTAKSGGGKTSLLDYIASQWQEENASTLFMRAKDLHADDFMLSIRDLLSLDENVTVFDFITYGISSDKQLIIVLDGLNEHANPNDLLASVIRFCKEVEDNNQIKFLLSCRDEHQIPWNTNIRIDRTLFYEKSDSKTGSFSRSQNGKGEVLTKPPDLYLRPLTAYEIKDCWATFSEQAARDFKPRFSYAKLRVTSFSTAAMLSNPLVLRIFLEVYHDEDLPSNITRHDLFEEYFDFLCKFTEDKGVFLDDFARLCLEHESREIDLDLLYDDKRTKTQVTTNDLGSVYSCLIHKGVLTETLTSDGILVSFTAELFMEHVISRILCKDDRAKTPEGVVEILKENQALLKLGHCEAVLHRKVKEEGVKFLAEFISISRSDFDLRAASLVLGQLVIEAESPALFVYRVFPVLLKNELLAIISATNLFLDKELADDQTLEFLLACEENLHEDLKSSKEMVLFLHEVQYFKSKIGSFDEALKYGEKALASNLKVVGPDHPDAGASYMKTAQAFLDNDNYESAIEYQKEALRIFECTYGEEHYEVATCHNVIGFACLNKGSDLEEAIKHLEKALNLFLKVLGHEKPEVGTCYHNLGVAHSRLRRDHMALEYCEKALELQIKIYGPDHPNVTATNKNLGEFYLNKKDDEKANLYLGESLKSSLKTVEDEDSIEAKGKDYMAEGIKHAEVGDWKKAEDSFLKSLDLMKLYSPNSHEMAGSHKFMAEFYIGGEEYDKAIEHYEKGLDIFLNIYGEEHLEVASVYNLIGIAYRSKNSSERAIENYEHSLEIRLKVLGSDHIEVSNCYYNIATALTDLKEYSKAIKYYNKALSIDLKFPGQIESVAATYHNIGTNYADLGNYKRAKRFLLKAKSVLIKIHGPQHHRVMQTQELIRQLKSL